MTTETILIVLFASLIGIGYLLYIRQRDIYEKEPFFVLLIVTICGGICAVAISLLIYNIIPVERTVSDSIMKIGPIEEASKIISLALLYPFVKRYINEIVDGLVYVSVIALGFSIIENIMYALNSSEPGVTLFYRSIFSTIGHIVFSGYMGIAFFIHMRIHKNYFGLITSLIIASLLHGIYNSILFVSEVSGIFKLFFYGIIFLQIWFYKVALGFSECKKALNLNNFNETGNTAFLYCNHCEQSIKAKERSIWKIKAGVCENCGNLVFEAGHIWILFAYYRPLFKTKKYRKEIQDSQRIISFCGGEKIKFNVNRESLSGDIEELNEWLSQANEQDKIKVLKQGFIGWILGLLGYRFLVIKSTMELPSSDRKSNSTYINDEI